MMAAFVANTNILELRGLQIATDETYVNDATVSVTVKDDCGLVVSGQTWPALMQYVSASNGDYRLTIANTLQLKSGKQYFAEITATNGGSATGFWRYPFRPQTRQ
jgi:hypothetical protein